MISKVTMPKFGWTMQEGKITDWLKNEGDRVQKGEPLFIIETEKITSEVESPAAGVLRKIIAPIGVPMKVGSLVGIIAEADEVIPDNVEIMGKPEGLFVTSSHQESEPKGIVMAEEKSEKLQKVTPAARRLAQEYGIDISKIKGTGPDGRIIREDLLKAIEQEKKPGMRPIPMVGLRKVTAERMSFSAHTSARVTITTEANASALVQLRTKFQENEKRNISYTHFLIKIIAKALEEHPLLNSVVVDEQPQIIDQINIGVATASESGLLVPVIHDANKKPLNEIALLTDGLVEKARQNKLSAEEATGSTFTITNLGMFGVDAFTPLMNPPECAILGVGRILNKPVADENQITIRPLMTLSLSFDHRYIDGEPAARFLQRVCELLNEPKIWL